MGLLNLQAEKRKVWPLSAHGGESDDRGLGCATV
jgi:hypothetical protein